MAIALLVAAVTDLRSRQIHNWLTGGIALGAPLFWIASAYPLLPGEAWFFGPPSVVMQFAVALAAFAVLAGLFALRAMGGGDVKLLTALALWVQPAHFLQLLLVMAVLGGVLTLAFGMWHIARRQKERLAIPYGVAIAAAGLWVLGTNYLPAASAGAAGLG